MTTHERTMYVASDPDEVFALLSDPDRIPAYIAEVTSAEPGPDGLVRLYTTVGAKVTEVLVRLVANPGAYEISWALEGRDNPENVRGTVRVIPAEGGGSRVIVETVEVPQSTRTEQLDQRPWIPHTDISTAGGEIPVDEPRGEWLAADARRLGAVVLIERLLEDFRAYAETGHRAHGRPR